MLLLDPKGPIGEETRFVIVAAFALMLIVVIPVFILAVWFPLAYRASGRKAVYLPKWSKSVKIDLIIWLIPIVIVTLLGILAWKKTHDLDPYKPIDSSVEPVRIEVVSLDWKWLFIYPDYDIAAIAELVFPVRVPLSFRLTSDTVMTSFFIPQLGSQIYAMGGMQTRLHLLANEAGVYDGQNQQFSGRGYSGMTFKAIAVPQDQFEAWVQRAKQAPGKLDSDRFAELEKPSANSPVEYFSAVQPDLFDLVLGKFMSMDMDSGSMPMNPGVAEGQ